MKSNDGSEVTLSSFLGETPLVIFFYPKVVQVHNLDPHVYT